MKSSKYNMLWTLDDGRKIAFNSFTCALAEIDDSFLEVLDNAENIVYSKLEGDQKQLVEDMLEGNYLVKDNIDEVKLLKFKNYSGKFTFNNLGLTIAPTLVCNFACPYCYESPKTGLMSEEVQQGIIDMVIEAAEHKKDVDVTWYGGEPLLAINLISNLSERMIKICEENGVKYSAYMVTNGYLLNDEVIEKLKDAKVDGAQITMDGPPHIHNQRRKLKVKEADTFYIILENIKKMLQSGLRVNLRINVDKSNTEYVGELLDILEQNNLKEAVGIGFGHVTAYTESCKSIVSSCMNTEEYAEMNIQYQDMLYKRGFYSQGYPYYPGIKANYCCADNISAFVIDHEGYMYKCWNDVGTVEKSVGNVKNTKAKVVDEDAIMRNADYILWSPFEHQECIDCNLLPICMGGCPYTGSQKGAKPQCEKWKYTLADALKNIYVQKTSCKDSECNEACSCK